MSAEESYQGSSWFPSDNNFSRIAGFSFVVSVLRGLLNSQGTVTGDVGAGVRGPNSYLIDSLKLLLLGWIIEGGRRFLAWVMGRFKPLQYSITAQFVESDPTYEWLILFLTEEKIWSRSRHFYVNATSSKRRWSVTLESDEKKEDDDEEKHVDYVPSYGHPQIFRWKGHWVEVERTTVYSYSPHGGDRALGNISLTIYTRDMGALSALVEEARQRYLKTSRPHVIVHTADQPSYRVDQTFNGVKRKARRALNSVVLEDGVISSLIDDAREFFRTEEWYTKAGIPHRRGYLLYGPPGTGKSSTIYALAGELGLEIYSISLASTFIDDAFLSRAVAAIPKQAIFLIEDIDCAFPSREELEADGSAGSSDSIGYRNGGRPRRPRSEVTLSGLLNVLDGVASEEGKIFFATTNYVDELDPALMRPGRIDRKIEYKLATSAQAAALFLKFYPEAMTTLRSETSSGSDKSIPFEPSEKHSILRSLSEQFAVAVPEDTFSTAELQGFLLSCKQEPEHAVERIAEWVEDEKRERAAKAKREAERRTKAKAKKDAREAEFFKDVLARLGVNTGHANGSLPSGSVSPSNVVASAGKDVHPPSGSTDTDSGKVVSQDTGTDATSSDKVLTVTKPLALVNGTNKEVNASPTD